jgi:hypothetical protein
MDSRVSCTKSSVMVDYERVILGMSKRLSAIGARRGIPAVMRVSKSRIGVLKQESYEQPTHKEPKLVPLL